MAIRIDKITVIIETTQDFDGHKETIFQVIEPDSNDPFVVAIHDKHLQVLKDGLAAHPIQNLLLF